MGALKVVLIWDGCRPIGAPALAEVANATERGSQRVCTRPGLVTGFLPTPVSPSTHQSSTRPTKRK